MKMEQNSCTYHAICASQYRDHDSRAVASMYSLHRITAFSAGNPPEISPGLSKVHSGETTGMRPACDERSFVAINTLTLTLDSTIAQMNA